MDTERDRESLAPSVVVANILILCLAIISVALRLWSRRLAKAGFWYDDYAIVAALPIAIVLPVLLLIAVRYDFGKHVAVARPDAETKWFKILYIFEIFYPPSVAITKLSILLFYARIFPTRNFTRVLYAVGSFTLVWCVSTQLVAIFQCHPIHSFWTRFSGNSKCIDLKAFFIGQAVPNIITDLVILVLPLPLIWRLQLPVSQKLMLTGCFTFGAFVAFTSIYRLYLFTKLRPYDDTYNDAKAANWSSLEANVGITSACLPMCRPLVMLLISKSRDFRASKNSVRELTVFGPHHSPQPAVPTKSQNAARLSRVHEDEEALKAVEESDGSLRSTEVCNKATAQENRVSKPLTDELPKISPVKSEVGSPDWASSRSMV